MSSFKSLFIKRPKAKPQTQTLPSLLSMGRSPEEPKPVNGVISQPFANSSPNPTARANSISMISGLHSHRNVKPVHQMLLAESMYEPSVALNLQCRLNPTLRQTLKDNTVFPYFLQFMESLGKNSKNLIRFWLQTECLIISQTDIQTEHRMSSDFKQQFINDSMRLCDKYLSQDSNNGIDIPRELKSQIKDSLCPEKCDSLPELFRKVQNCVIDIIDVQFYDSFLMSSYYNKFEIELLTSGSISLADILFNNSTLAISFIEFMESESMKAYVDFLIMFENYRKVSNNYDDAIAIFNRFFCSDETTNKLSFSENLVLSLSEKLVKNNFSCDCLDRAAAVLIQYFEKTYLKQFIESQFFIEYLNNCFHAIQSTSNAIKQSQSHRRTNSDSSYTSDTSFVAALDRSSASASSQSQSQTQSNPKQRHPSDDLKSDALWKRDLSGKLQFTHVDQYGRLSSQLEPEPEPKGVGPLAKVMQKLSLNISSEENEEIAWKIAAMIVNDVSNTCNRSATPEQSSQSSHNRL